MKKITIAGVEFEYRIDVRRYPSGTEVETRFYRGRKKDRKFLGLRIKGSPIFVFSVPFDIESPGFSMSWLRENLQEAWGKHLNWEKRKAQIAAGNLI